MTQDQLQAQIDRLTTTNLDLLRKLKRAEKTLHDWFMGQAIAGAAWQHHDRRAR